MPLLGVTSNRIQPALPQKFTPVAVQGFLRLGGGLQLLGGRLRSAKVLHSFSHLLLAAGCSTLRSIMSGTVYQLQQTLILRHTGFLSDPN